MASKATARYIWDWFKSNTNLPDIGIAAIMGNFDAESNLEPIRKQGDFSPNRSASHSYMAKADAGDLSDFCSGNIGWGLAQWTHPGRCRDLYDFAKSKGKSVGDLDTQLAYCWAELTGEFSNVLYTLRTAASIRIASDKVLHVYENPRDQGTKVQEKRAEYAQNFYNAFHQEDKPKRSKSEIISDIKTLLTELEGTDGK